jgi:hypothetical protein
VFKTIYYLHMHICSTWQNESYLRKIVEEMGIEIDP